MAKRGRKKINKAKDDKGYLESNKDNFTDYKVIDGNKITMKGVKGKIYAIPVDSKGNAGKGRLMSPDEEHEFEGATQIIELPESAMAQAGQRVNHGDGFLGFAGRIGGAVGNTVDSIHNAFGGLDYAILNPQSNNYIGNWGLGGQPANAAPTTEEEKDWTGGVGNFTHGDNGASLVPNLGDRGVFEQYPSQPERGLDTNIFDKYPAKPIPQQVGDITETPIPQQVGETSTTPIPKQIGDTTETSSSTGEEVNYGEASSNQGEIEETEKIRFNNLYNGVDLTSASNILGKSFGYEGDQQGANAARGIGSGLKLLAGLGRNIMSGYGQQKRNQHLMEESRKKRRRAAQGETISAQKGALVKKDLDVIKDTTGLDFNAEVANNIFERVPPRGATSQYPEIDFGRYKDTGYFRTGEMHNGKVVVHNTERNPMNYDDNKRNALAYLRELNGDNFEFQYLDSQQRRPQQPTQIVSRKKGGEVKPADLLSGAYITGDDTVTPNVNVEEGEHVLDNETGRVAEVAGEKHTQGGENLNLDGAVLSDYNKIGGDLAKKYRNEFDINVKAKDTFATAFDKVLKKTGYKSLTDEMSKYIEKTEKEQEKAKEVGSEATTGLNMQFLSGKINELNKQIEPLEDMKSQVFQKFFADQQAAKSPEELAEENSGEEVPEAARGMKVDPRYYDMLSAAESAGDPNAKARTSSASGEFQFIESTWKRMVDKLGLDYTLDDRFDPEKSRVVVEALTEENEEILKRDLGREPTASELYLAHFLGITKARKAVKAMQEDPSTNIEDIVGAEQVRANPNVFKNIKNVGDLYNWSSGKFKGIDGELPDVPEGIKRQEPKAGENPYPDRPVRRGAPTPENRFPEVDTTEKSDFEGDPNDPTFKRWFYQTYGGENPTAPAVGAGLESKGFEPMDVEGIEDVDVPEIDAPISEEERTRRAALEAAGEGDAETVDERTDNTRYETPLLPDQTPLPPSSLRLTDLQGITPRDAEAKLISPDTQIEEINRQFLAAKRSLDTLPASERVAALAKLQSQTQQSINQVMAATNQQNAQIKGQTEQFNNQSRTNADIANINAAKQYERETLSAVDKTEQEINNWFNRIQENQMGNKLTVDELNLMNQNASDFQYNANGEVEQTGKGLSSQDIVQRMQQMGYGQAEIDEVLGKKKKSKTAQRGRKV